MKCFSCHINIPAGIAARKMIVEYRQPDGSVKVFGYMMADGRLDQATGQILRGYHSKCFWVRKKREGRGDPVTGRVLGVVPTGYDITALTPTGDDLASLTAQELTERTTATLSQRLDQLRAISRQVGKPVGDPYVTEAYAAHERGGPYRHTHHLRMDAYQLAAHLRFAHGHTTADSRGWQAIHDELHAAAVLAATIAARDDDPGHDSPTETDWRSQTIADVAELA